MSGFAVNWQLFYSASMVILMAGVLSFAGSVASLRIARRSGMIVEPGERQSHTVATPTGGGLGIIFSLVASSLIMQFFISLPVFWWQFMLPGLLLLAFTGWLDDKRHVAPLTRLLVQLVVSIWIVVFICSQAPYEQIGWCLGIILFMVWSMNIYNFMDGSNGMAGFQAIFAGSVLAFLFYAGNQTAMAAISLAVAAASGGFLPLNFPVAKLFMGDVASVALGFIFASLMVYGVYVEILNAETAFLILSVFFVDATLTLVTRVLCGERWYTAHNQHVYQRLIVHGWSHWSVLIVYQLINVVIVLPAIVLSVMYPQNAMLTAGLTVGLLGSCWLIANRRLGAGAMLQLK